MISIIFVFVMAVLLILLIYSLEQSADNGEVRDERYQNREKLKKAFSELKEGMTKEEVFELIKEEGVAFSPSTESKVKMDEDSEIQVYLWELEVGRVMMGAPGAQRKTTTYGYIQVTFQDGKVFSIESSGF